MWYSFNCHKYSQKVVALYSLISQKKIEKKIHRLKKIHWIKNEHFSLGKLSCFDKGKDLFCQLLGLFPVGIMACFFHNLNT